MWWKIDCGNDEFRGYCTRASLSLSLSLNKKKNIKPNSEVPQAISDFHRRNTADCRPTKATNKTQIVLFQIKKKKTLQSITPRMNAKCLFMLLVVSAMCTIYCVHGDNQSPPSVVTTPMSATPPPSRTTDDNGNFNQTELMLACNETFHTSMGKRF